MMAAEPMVVENPAATCGSSESLMRMLSAPPNAASANSTMVRSGGSAGTPSVGTLMISRAPYRCSAR